MSKLYNLVKLYKNGNKNAIIDIIEIYNPVLNKFNRNSYSEDMKNDLILFMITLLDKIAIEKKEFKEDKYIFSYIYKSLKHRYIYENSKRCHIYNNETTYDVLLNDVSYDNNFSNIVFKDMVKNLTKSEKYVINKKYLFNLSEADIARELAISRQAVHKTHKRALNKLRKLHSNMQELIL